MKLGNREGSRVGQLSLVLAAGALGVSLGCGNKDKDETAATTVLPYSGIAIAGVPSDYSSSKLFFQPLKDGATTGDLRTLLSGESGDPWLTTLNDKLYFFNRTGTSSNFRTIDTKQSDGAPGTQVRIEKPGAGDPHDALWLSSDRVLLAHYVANKLVVVNPADGSVKQEITADWDLGADPQAVFRPEAFYRVNNSVPGEIYVVNQGRTADLFGYTGAQQIFVLKDDGNTISVVDVDTAKEKVQGIKLKVMNPQIIYAGDDATKPIVAGFCTIWDTASPCVSGFERVDLAARTSTLVLDRSAATEKGNGSVIGTKNGKYYGVVAVSDGASGYKSQLQVLDINAGTAKTFYEIADANYADYSLGYDLSSNKLYVGEKKTDGTGQFTIFDLTTESSTPAATLSLPLVPYKIKFVP